jgi:hypothetical protein
MNVRFANQSIRFRVNNDELQRLLAGKAVALEVSLFNSRMFRANISSGVMGPWQLESDPTGLWLSVPREELKTLAATLPNKEGLGHEFKTNQGELRVALEVDLKRAPSNS